MFCNLWEIVKVPYTSYEWMGERFSLATYKFICMNISYKFTPELFSLGIIESSIIFVYHTSKRKIYAYNNILGWDWLFTEMKVLNQKDEATNWMVAIIIPKVLVGISKLCIY